MDFPVRCARTLPLCGMPLLLIVTMVSSGRAADESRPGERRVEREKRFLVRAVEDLDKSQSYVADMMAGLDRQIDGMQLLESARRENDLRDLLDWYYRYASWLSEYRARFEEDITALYADGPGPRGWSTRYAEMATGYGQLAGELQNIVGRQEYDKGQVEKRLVELRSRLNYLAELRDRDRDRSDRDKDSRDQDKDRRDRDQQRRPDRDQADKIRDERWDSRKAAEMARLATAIPAYEKLLMHLAISLEVGKYELHWISSKAGDCAALNEVARSIERGGRASRDDGYHMILRTYESDRIYFQKRIEDIDRKRSRIVGVGTHYTLERLDELSEYYHKMKRRYESHITWLSQQISAYRAEQTGM